MNKKLLCALSLYTNRMTEDIIKMTFSDHDSDNDILEEDLQDYFREVEDRLGHEVDPPDRIFFYTPLINKDSVENDIEEVLGDDYFKEIGISVALFHDQDELSVSADNVIIDGTSPGIHLNIFLTTEYSQMTSDSALDDTLLFDELGNAIRHEFEHLLQEDYPSVLNYLDYHKIFCPSSRKPSAFFLYLVQPAEVSAHVRGYEHNALTRSVFFKSIRNLLTVYNQKGILSEAEVIIVLMCWEDWFLRNTYLPLESTSGEAHV